MKRRYWLTFAALVLLGVACGSLLWNSRGNSVPEDNSRKRSSGLTTNYAFSYLGATLTDFSPACKGASSVLSEDKEKYMICACSARRKMFTVQLIREIEVRIITLVNLEHFSSGVKNFTLLGSRRYPTSEWRVLGNFEAGPWRGTQHFDVATQDPVRFLRLLWVTSHGNDAWCTLTAFKVFGVDVLETLTEDYTNDVDDFIQKTPDTTSLVLPNVGIPATSGRKGADGHSSTVSMGLNFQEEKKPIDKRSLSTLLDQVNDIVSGGVGSSGKEGDDRSNNSRTHMVATDYCDYEVEIINASKVCLPHEYHAYVARSKCTCPARPMITGKVTLHSKAYQGGTALQILAQMSKHLKNLQQELDESHIRQKEMQGRLEEAETTVGLLGKNLRDTLRVAIDHRDKLLEMKKEVDVMNSRLLLRSESGNYKRHGPTLWVWVVCSNVIALIAFFAAFFSIRPNLQSGTRRFTLRRFSQ